MQQRDLNTMLDVVETTRRARKEAADDLPLDGPHGTYIDALLSAMSRVEDKLVMALNQRVGWTPKHENDSLVGIYKTLAHYFE